MIALTIDHARLPEGKFVIRGAPLEFWQSRLLASFANRPLDQLAADFTFLIVLDAAVFIPAEPETCRRVSLFLKSQRASIRDVFVWPECSAVAVSKAFFTHHRREFTDGVLRFLKKEAAGHELPGLDCRPLSPKSDLPAIEKLIVNLQVRDLIRKGVMVEDIGNFYLEKGSNVGAASRIGSGAVIKGRSRVGKNVQIYPHCYLENSIIGDGCRLLPGTVVIDSRIEADVQLGPYAHLRSGSLVKSGAKLGNFVEMKKSVLGPGSKAMHLSYLGDARIGAEVNIGAGTITCNFDGIKKNPTRIEDRVFIGSGTELVAPVVIRRHAYVGAGSTITQDVPANALAIARQRQINIKDWVLRKRPEPKGEGLELRRPSRRDGLRKQRRKKKASRV